MFGVSQREPAADPEPSSTPGTERGGGVTPGDTPPTAASATEGLGGVRQPPPAGGGPSIKLIGLIFLVLALVVIAGVVLWAAVYG